MLEPVQRTIEEFFAGENLTLPRGQTWRDVSANVFSVVDGKKLLFEDKNSLFVRLRTCDPSVDVLREVVAASMAKDDLHEDIHTFFRRLREAVEGSQA